MPASNPIIGGKHITSYSNVAGSTQEPSATDVFPIPSSKGYNVPVAVIVGFCLLLLLMFRVWGFQALASARISA